MSRRNYGLWKQTRFPRPIGTLERTRKPRPKVRETHHTRALNRVTKAGHVITVGERRPPRPKKAVVKKRGRS